VTLDLTGTIPSAEAVRTFLADPSTDKRTQLVDQLIASPEHARRLQYVFDTMLMERRPDKHVPATEGATTYETRFGITNPGTSWSTKS